MKSKFPSVKFYVNRIEDEFDTVWYFLNPKKNDFNWSKTILNEYPFFKKI